MSLDFAMLESVALRACGQGMRHKWFELSAYDQARIIDGAELTINAAVFVGVVTESKPVVDRMKTAREHVAQLRHHLAASGSIDALLILDLIDTQIVSALNRVAVRISPAPPSPTSGAETQPSTTPNPAK